MLTYALTTLNLENERRVTPLPIQAYADDIVVVTHSLNTLHSMIQICEPVMEDAGLDVKISKSGCFYGRRSGNNWYTGKSDVVPVSIFKEKNCQFTKGRNLINN